MFFNKPMTTDADQAAGKQPETPNKVELYRKLWGRHAQTKYDPSVIVQEVIDTCRGQGAEFNDVLTAAIAAKNEDLAADATMGA